jgi:ankyrin repeat protein
MNAVPSTSIQEVGARRKLLHTMPIQNKRIKLRSRPDFQSSVDETRPVTIDEAANSWWKKFSGYHCWELKGPLAITYAKLGPRILEELKLFGKESSSEVSVSPFMVGKTPGKARPMIVISGDKESREAAKSLIEKSSIIESSEFELWLLRHPPSGSIRPVAIENDHILETLPLNSRIYIDPTEPFRLIGMPIYILHSPQSIRRATANAIYNGKEYAYITAAHAFVQTSVNVQVSEADDEDFEMPFDSDSEDGSFDDELLSQHSQTSPDESENFSTASSRPPRSRTTSRSQSRPESPSSSEKPINQNQPLGDLEAPKHLEPNSTVYSPRQYDTLGEVMEISFSRDFAVISDASNQVERYLKTRKDGMKNRGFTVQVSKASHTQVIAWTSHGATPGHLAELPVYVSLPSIKLAGMVYKFTYSDGAHGGIRMGDCGSLVTSEQHTELFGHIFAKSENSNVAYIVAAEQIATDIKGTGNWSYSYLDDIECEFFSSYKIDRRVVKTVNDCVRPLDKTGEDTLGLMPLWWAAQNGHERGVQRLLGIDGIDINSMFPSGRTPLLLAAQCGYKSVVKLLLDTGKAEANSKTEDGWTPLLWAARKGHEAVAKLLLDTGKVEADVKDKAGKTPLLWAAELGHVQVVKLLLDTGKVDINATDKAGWTPLIWATSNGHDAVVKVLLETGKVDANSRDQDGWTPLIWAARQGDEIVVELLLETIKVDANSKDTLEGQTPLSWAARQGHEAVVKLLLENVKVNIDLKDNTGRTPLAWAAMNGHEAIIKLLLETGQVDVISEDKFGRTPLSWAKTYGRNAVVKLLQPH